MIDNDLGNMLLKGNVSLLAVWNKVVWTMRRRERSFGDFDDLPLPDFTDTETGLKYILHRSYNGLLFTAKHIAMEKQNVKVGVKKVSFGYPHRSSITGRDVFEKRYVYDQVGKIIGPLIFYTSAGDEVCAVPKLVIIKAKEIHDHTERERIKKYRNEWNGVRHKGGMASYNPGQTIQYEAQVIDTQATTEEN